MNKNHFKIAIRNILKHPFYSGLNIMSFTLSISVSLAVIFIIYNQFNYDNGNKDRNRIYRINTLVENTKGDKGKYATVPYSTKELLDSAVFSEYVNIVSLNTRTLYFGNKGINAAGGIVEGNYLDFFKFPIAAGDYKTFKAHANGIALSKTTCLKIFNSTDCLGKVIDIKDLGNFMVSLVYDDTRIKSVIANDFLLNDGLIPSSVIKGSLDSSLYSINNFTSSYLFVLLDKALSKKELDGITKSMSYSAMSAFKSQDNIKNISFFTLPFANLSPSPGFWMENSKALDKSAIIVLMAAVVILIGFTAFNYSSVMMALGLSRTKEIGIKKLLGAKRPDIFFQFIVEAVIISLTSTFLGLLFFPFVAKLSPLQELTAHARFEIPIIFYFMLFAIVSGFVAGAVPAFTLSAYNGLQLIRNSLNSAAAKKFSLRKAIIVFQFSISFCLILIVIVFLGQTRFMAESDYGFSYKNMISIPVYDSAEQAIVRDEIARMPGVLGVSGISTNLGYMPTEEFNAWKYGEKERKIQLGSYIIDHNSVEELGLTMIAGSNFNSNPGSNFNQILINETGCKELNFSDPNQCIGQELYLDDTTKCRILGVVKDFHYQNFRRFITPMIFRYDLSKLQFVNARIHPSMTDAFQTRLSSVQLSKKLGRPLEFIPWGKEYREKQRHQDGMLTITFLTLTLITIGCLGLVGMVSYSALQRIKEITIRKIIGANLWQIFTLLTKEYFLLLSLATLIGIPVGYMISQQAISGFAYRIQIGFQLVLLSIGIITLISVTVLVLVTVKTCLIKPANKLRE